MEKEELTFEKTMESTTKKKRLSKNAKEKKSLFRKVKRVPQPFTRETSVEKGAEYGCPRTKKEKKSRMESERKTRPNVKKRE